jgi:DtxR family Mn-dependent transcriptional regulator
MERDGLVVVAEDRRLLLTDDGRKKAIEVMRKHRLAERLLSDVIGLDWAYVHEEACRWEHVMSERVEHRLVELLGYPTESPYGNPIPGLEQLGEQGSGHPFEEGVVGLVKHLDASDGQSRGMVRRLAEPAQVDPDLLEQLREAGVVPGANGDFRYSEGYVLVQMDGNENALELPLEIASHVFLVDASA